MLRMAVADSYGGTAERPECRFRRRRRRSSLCREWNGDGLWRHGETCFQEFQLTLQRRGVHGECSKQPLVGVDLAMVPLQRNACSNPKCACAGRFVTEERSGGASRR